MDLLPESTDTLQLLRRGRIEVEGRLVSASNATFYCSISLDGVTVAGVYKPVRGERPLWDFAHGSLARREVATYLFSAASGWDLVPPTVLRDGPFGEGMCQLWIEHDPDHGVVDIVPRGAVPDGWRTVLEAYDGDGDEVLLIHADHDQLRRIAIVDTIVNNADRKGGHVLLAEDGHVFGIDHGLCFHEDDKLRTVLWGWAGEPLPQADLDVLERLGCELDGQVGRSLSELLEVHEIAALRARLARLHRQGRLPQPGDGWPSVPWPVF
ncbi:SCO1664 family protein [Actinopolymorpha sp. B17G11]|uniref:SCO1664 family protein n=1 Tax=unclassified Actinopolymorpha TaxID=2627063 RepID=UPI0032D8EE0E